MDLTHSPRHKRRGFYRGNSTAPSRSAAVNSLRSNRGNSGAGERFLAWLADEISGGGSKDNPSTIDICHRETARRILESVNRADAYKRYSDEAHRLLSNLRMAVSSDVDDAAEPYLDGELALDDFDLDEMYIEEELDLSFGLTAPVDGDEKQPDAAEYEQALRQRARPHPKVEVGHDGQRLETFAAGSKVTKDALGRVIEITSQYGDCLYLHYGTFGHLESFARTDAKGRPHSLGRVEKHGVVIRDQEGRVRATGQCMAIDPWGCFYLHGTKGQYYSLDLVSGVHCERRKIATTDGERFVTAIFTHDGFRMATVFARLAADDTIAGGTPEDGLCFRFYGRDGTMVEFPSETRLRELRPSRVLGPGSRTVDQSWRKVRQAATAWEAVHQYLERVS